ncbi:heme ABC exporter, ATP-binding protein CcmA, partial [mine drainage metagenome]
TSDEHRSRTLYLAHSDGLKGALTGEENLHLFATLRKFRDRTEEIEEGLDYYEMGALKAVPCLRLSQGQRRRIALSRLHAFPASLWLLDEPTTALDRAGIERFSDHLSSHLAGGGMAILATHQNLPERLRPTMRIALGNAS